ncbi:MAG: hypothetical protein AB7U20_14290 [Planctomycetaceae bacterium]
MTIDDLIERLEEYRDEIGGDAEVRLMTQSHWPFENTIYGLASGAEVKEQIRYAADDFADDEDDGDDDDAVDAGVLYICEGQQLGYGVKDAWDAAQ